MDDDMTLLPCPRCGRNPEVFSVNRAFRCPHDSPCAKNQGWMSFEDWNRRVHPQPLLTDNPENDNKPKATNSEAR